MYPVLFHIGGVPAETYYAIWLVALSLALAWIVRRFPGYGIDDDEGRRVVGRGFIGMLVGARAFELIWNFPVYWNDPSLILDLSRGGLAEVGALCGALAAVAALCWRNHRISFNRLCDACTPPIFFALALGRWGCFFAGCCVGIPSAFPTALHFPYDPPDVVRHPTQLYYAFFAAAALALLLWAERKIANQDRRWPLMPLGFLLYAAMRLSIDLLRDEGGKGFLLSHGIIYAGLPVALLWLLAPRAFLKGGKADDG